MWKCAVCGNEIGSNNLCFILNDNKICATCARSLTLEEISVSSEELDCAVTQKLIQADFTVKE